jgi:hypothetical protein
VRIRLTVLTGATLSIAVVAAVSTVVTPAASAAGVTTLSQTRTYADRLPAPPAFLPPPAGDVDRAKASSPSPDRDRSDAVLPAAARASAGRDATTALVESTVRANGTTSLTSAARAPPASCQPA